MPHLHGCKPPAKVQWYLCNQHISAWGRSRKEVRYDQNMLWSVAAQCTKSLSLRCRAAQDPANPEQQRVPLWSPWRTEHSLGNFYSGWHSRAQGWNHCCLKAMRSQASDEAFPIQMLQYLSWIHAMVLLFSYEFLFPNSSSPTCLGKRTKANEGGCCGWMQYNNKRISAKEVGFNMWI